MIVTKKIEQAKELAKRLHKEIDRDGKPHFDHVHRVALRVAARTGSELCIITAYCHDMLEDTELTYTELLALFGEEVAIATLALTRMDGEAFECFTERCAANEIAAPVRLDDMLDNMERIDDKMRKQEHLYLWAIDYLQNYND